MEKLEKSVLRNKSIGTKVSEDEYGQLEKLAEARGLTLSEWLRELALTELTAHSADEIILAEVLALRMLFLNTVQALGQKGELTTGETAVGTTSKAVVVTNIAENAGKPAITTIFSDGWSLAGLAERGLGWFAQGLMDVAPYAWGGAAIADLHTHAVCETGDPNVLMGIMP